MAKSLTEALERAIERIQRYGEKKSAVAVFLSPDLVLRSGATVNLSDIPAQRIVGTYAAWRFGFADHCLRDDVIQTLKQLAERFPGKPIEINPTRFRTRSPLRNERTPSVYISKTEDGTLLVKDFGGDSVAEMLGALGVDIASLFPPRPDQHYIKPTPARMAAIDLVRFLKDDLILVLAFARMIHRGEKLLETDFIALGKAIDRIHDGLSFGGVK